MEDELTVEGDIVADLQARSLAYTLLRKYPLREQGEAAQRQAEKWGELLEFPRHLIVRAFATWQGMAR
jgi:hypothetical protein